MSTAAVVQRGRPRSEEADRAIVRAALEVLAEEGAAEFSVEAVATRAGVGKSTIYRRFTGSQELLAEALASIAMPLLGALHATTACRCPHATWGCCRPTNSRISNSGWGPGRIWRSSTCSWRPSGRCSKPHRRQRPARSPHPPPARR